MSYRSLKRVLGETSLERKCRYLFGSCLLVLILGSFWWYGRSTDKLVRESSRETARSLVETIIVMQHEKLWQSEDDEKTGDKLAELVEDIRKGLASREYRWEFVRPVEEGPNGPKDEFELEVLKQFKPSVQPEADNTPTREFRERRIVVNGKPEYQFYAPIRITNRQCVLCHLSLNLGVDGVPPRTSATWSRWPKCACPTTRFRRRRATTTLFCWAPLSSPCFWPCWLPT